MRIHLNLRPRSKNGKKYVYYSLASSYRDKTGPKKHILENLGALTETEVAMWKTRLTVFNGDATNLVDIKQLEFTDSKNYLDVALLSLVYDRLGLNDVFKMATSSKEIGVQEVAKILVLSRCLDPSSNRKTVEWFEQSYLPMLMDVRSGAYNKDKIFHELEGIHKKKKWLQKHFFSQSKKIYPETNLYFFDGTTSFFEGSDCDLATPGKDKTTGFQSKTILICLLTDTAGFPIVWDVFEGNKRDVSEFKKIAKTMADDLNISNITICFDRGVASDSNFDTIEELLESKFITGLCKNQIADVFDIDKFCINTRGLLLEKYHNQGEITSSEKITITPINKFYRTGTDRFFKELGVTGKRRHVASFNAAIFEQEQITRKKNIENVKAEIAKLNDDLAMAARDRDESVTEKKIDDLLLKYSLKGIFQYTVIPLAGKEAGQIVQTYRINYTISEEEIEKASRFDGLFIFVTNHTESAGGHFIVSASTIVGHYKNKFVIENAFRHLKSIVDLRPFFVRLDDHVRAHVDICVSAYFINTWLYYKLKDKSISLEDFYSELKSNSPTCRLKNGIQNVVLLKTLSRKMKDILEALDANSIVEKEALERHQITPEK